MKNKQMWSGVVIAVLVVIALSACQSAQAAASALVFGGESGSTLIDEMALTETLAETAVGTLTEDEAAGLMYMREEEKLAHDVYSVLYAKWQLPVFQNIAASEQTHTEAVLGLLGRYGLSDPVTGRGVGEFADPTLQSLYDQLVAQGSTSVEAALRVGTAIEEIDIMDLEEYLAQTDKADIRRVYQNLLKGSRNHLRAFVRTLEQRTGITYVPQYMGAVAYEAIINSATERGNAGSNEQGNGNRGGNGQTSSGRGNRGRP